MKLTDISARSADLDGLMRSVKAGRIAHAFLFTGPKGTGKKTCARTLAQAALCTSPDAPCGLCPECKRFLAGTHPDVHTLETDARSISVDDIRALLDKLALKPFEGGRSIAFIFQADKMTPQAQNALLKTLEEPVGQVVFFLTSDQPGGILSTIVSRCRRVRFAPINIGDCAQALEKRGIEPARAALLAGCAQGSVGRALEINNIEGYFELRDRIIASLTALEKGAAGAADASSMAGGAKTLAPDALEIMEVTARDLMARENGAKPLTDTKNLRLDGRALLLEVMNIRRMLASNVSWENAVERAYLNMVSGRAV